MGKTMEGENAIYVMILEPDGETPVGTLSVPLQVAIPEWHYVGGEFITANGEVQATVPAEATAFTLAARGGAVNYNVNGATCSATSPGYVAEDGVQTVGPLDNLVRLCVYGGDATTYAHLQYWRKA